uniref:Uncharacterized protein n=1 Tax=Brassica oleracea TaxID=3712 RepID=A0A3P6EFS2_BRAOL|nr:unnamed protein product [Brassica oleracea]
MAFYMGVEVKLRVVISISNIVKETNFGISYQGFDTMPRDVRDQSRWGLGQDLGLLPGFRGAMVSQIVWLGVRDVFTQIAKDVVGQGLDHGTLTFKPPSG